MKGRCGEGQALGRSGPGEGQVPQVAQPGETWYGDIQTMIRTYNGSKVQITMTQ